jgi:hypothetical protein
MNMLPMSRACHNRLFFLTLALKTKTCAMALLPPTLSKFSPSLIEIMVSYKLLIEFSLGIGASSITFNP